MDKDQALRSHLVELLAGESAHASFDNAVRDVPEKVRAARLPGAQHSLWQLLEHLRIAQWDILEFSRNPNHESPDFPKGYWPADPAPPNADAWDKSANAFRADLRAMVEMIESEATDLYAPIPHGTGQTVLREALVLADHNAYHIGQFVMLRRVLGAWSAS